MENPHLYVTVRLLCKLLFQCQCQVATNSTSESKICVIQCHATGLGPDFLQFDAEIREDSVALILFLGILVGTPLMHSSMA